MIKFTCRCGANLTARDEQAGKSLTCPKCRTRLTIPPGRDRGGRGVAPPFPADKHSGIRSSSDGLRLRFALAAVIAVLLAGVCLMTDITLVRDKHPQPEPVAAEETKHHPIEVPAPSRPPEGEKPAEVAQTARAAEEQAKEAVPENRTVEAESPRALPKLQSAESMLAEKIEKWKADKSKAIADIEQAEDEMKELEVRLKAEEIVRKGSTKHNAFDRRKDIERKRLDAAFRRDVADVRLRLADQPFGKGEKHQPRDPLLVIRVAELLGKLKRITPDKNLVNPQRNYGWVLAENLTAADEELIRDSAAWGPLTANQGAENTLQLMGRLLNERDEENRLQAAVEQVRKERAVNDNSTKPTTGKATARKWR